MFLDRNTFDTDVSDAHLSLSGMEMGMGMGMGMVDGDGGWRWRWDGERRAFYAYRLAVSGIVAACPCCGCMRHSARQRFVQ